MYVNVMIRLLHWTPFWTLYDSSEPFSYSRKPYLSGSDEYSILGAFRASIIFNLSASCSGRFMTEEFDNMKERWSATNLVSARKMNDSQKGSADNSETHQFVSQDTRSRPHLLYRAKGFSASYTKNLQGMFSPRLIEHQPVWDWRIR